MENLNLKKINYQEIMDDAYAGNLFCKEIDSSIPFDDNWEKLPEYDWFMSPSGSLALPSDGNSTRTHIPEPISILIERRPEYYKD